MRGVTFALTGLMALLGCEGVVSRSSDAGASEDGRIPSGTGCDPTGRNAMIFEGLRPTCEGCHGRGTSQPLFADLASFENLLAYEPRFVTPGDAGGSELVRLLEGRGTSFRQMPIAGATFADLERSGATSIGLDAVRGWIDALAPCAAGAPPFEGPLVQRKSAHQIVVTLMDQLGLTDDDLYADEYRAVRREHLPARSPDAMPRPFSDRDLSEAFDRWRALGGGSFRDGTRGGTEVTPTFVQGFVPMAQAWCRLAVEKPGNTAIFQASSPSDATTSAEARGRIEADVARLYLRMLGEPADADDVAGLMGVFTAYEPEGMPVAWTAVCATLARDPLWVTY